MSSMLVAIMALVWGQFQAMPASLTSWAQTPPHVLVQPDAVVWRGQPGQLQTAIAEGNPQAAGPFTMLLKLPDGVWIQPHFHNVDKRLIVITGELLMGHGDAIDSAKTTALKTGGVAVMPANAHHYEGGKGETIVALIANGPFTTTMVQAGSTAGSAAAVSTSGARIASLPVTSRVFGNTRTLRVYLPAGYDDPQRATERYPVLYFNDGFAVFSERSWNAPKTLDQLIGAGVIPATIVVGIPNAASIDGSANPGRDRTNEYLPYPDVTEPDLPNPQGLRYPDFIVDEVMPLISRTYRTLSGPANTGMAGSSYGGIAALVMALRRPGLFGSLMLESTPLFLFNERLTTETAAAKSLPASVWVAVGTKETDDAAVLSAGQKALDRFVEVLRSRSLRVSYTVVDGGTHTSAAWAARLPAALKFLYGSAPAAIGVATGACTARNDPGAVAAVRAVAEGIIAADNDRAIDRVLSYYDAAATLWPPNDAPVTGRATIRLRYQQLFDASQPKLTTAIDAICVDSSIAIVEGRNGGSFEPRHAAGTARSVSDRYVMVLGLGADRVWRITHLTWRPPA